MAAEPGLPVITIWRETTGPEGTFGRLFTPKKQWDCLTLECPNLNNQPYKSCIPPGEYRCEFRNSPSKGWRYEVQDVPGRTHILIHPGNWAAGKNSKGLRSDSLGCILLGNKLATIKGQQAVLGSKDTVRKFEAWLKKEPFMLRIDEARGYHPGDFDK